MGSGPDGHKENPCVREAAIVETHEIAVLSYDDSPFSFGKEKLRCICRRNEPSFARRRYTDPTIAKQPRYFRADILIEMKAKRSSGMRSLEEAKMLFLLFSALGFCHLNGSVLVELGFRVLSLSNLSVVVSEQHVLNWVAE